MSKIDLNSIIPIALRNSDNNSEMRDVKFNTTDLIYIESLDEFDNESKNENYRYAPATDWALANGGAGAREAVTVNGKSSRIPFWLRSSDSNKFVHYVSIEVNYCYDYVLRNFGVRPKMRLDISLIKKDLKENFKVIAINDNYYDTAYYVIKFGEYPKTFVGEKINSDFEKLYKNSRINVIKPTGKKYTAFINSSEQKYYEEYEYNGDKYVRVKANCSDKSLYSDGSEVINNEYVWIKVEPITWKIRNWDDMPKEINPYGKGKAEFIDVITEDAIMAMPFYPNNEDKNRLMWQNSTIRGYLNGINVNNIKTNGNTKFTASNGGNFKDTNNFLSEAFNKEIYKENTKVDKKTRKGYGVKVVDKPMLVNEQIDFYIKAGKSFMLHGVSGIGKTRRIEEADPDFVSIVLRNGILPEEVIGKTIYPNNDTTKTGVWVPPAWYTALCEKCEKEPTKKHVLFIDEITNVRPTEQSLVFHLVLNNSIGPNVGKLPENVVVVAAGNSKEESEAAYNMPEPLFRRFDGHVYLDLDLTNWLEWGSEPSSKGEDRLKVHPLVSAFVSTMGDKVFYSNYNSEEPPKYAIDPRGWEQISDIIYDNDGVIAKELIENKVGKEIAASFIAFAKTTQITIEDVLEGNYEAHEIPTTFDAKYALALSLKSASDEEISVVREFVKKELGSEITAMFDSVWIGEDNERAILIDNLIKNGNLKSQKNQNLNSHENENSNGQKSSYKITVDEFWKLKDKTGIYCNNMEQAKILCEVFDKMGKKWSNKISYKDKNEFEKIIKYYGSGVIFFNNGLYSDTKFAQFAQEYNMTIYDFSEVDLSKYTNTKNIYKTTIEESFKER